MTEVRGNVTHEYKTGEYDREKVSSSTTPDSTETAARANDSERRVASVSREIAATAPEIAAGRQSSRDLRVPPTSRESSDFPRRLACERRSSFGLNRV
jgi:hypothetical protein